MVLYSRAQRICGFYAIRRLVWGLSSRPRRLNLDRDSSICLQVGDEDSRHEGVEIERSSPFHLSRILAKEFGYRSVSYDLDQKICVWKRSDVDVLQTTQARASRGSRWWDLKLEIVLSLRTQGTEPASCGRWYLTEKQPSRSELSRISGGRVSSPLSS